MSFVERSDRESSLAQTFVLLADTLVSEFDVTDLFDRLASACVDVLGAAAAGLMLADGDGHLHLTASSSDAMRVLEEFEAEVGEGPCFDAYARREAVSHELSDEAARQDWPRFTQAALRSGFTGVQALPMRLRAETVGALDVFHTGVELLTAHDTALVQALADITTIALLHHRALRDSQELAGHLQIALNDRIVIEQAKGLLAERGRLHVDAAFVLLRNYCRSAQLPLTRTARELVEGRRSADQLLNDG
jgi:GAF domain-containing protein